MLLERLELRLIELFGERFCAVQGGFDFFKRLGFVILAQEGFGEEALVVGNVGSAAGGEPGFDAAADFGDADFGAAACGPGPTS